MDGYQEGSPTGTTPTSEAPLSMSDTSARTSGKPTLRPVPSGKDIIDLPQMWTAAEFVANVPEPSWLLEPWIAEGSITELNGIQKEAAKTTLALAMVHSLTTGTSFLGEAPPEPTNVIYLTEEGSSFVNSLERARLEASGRLYVRPYFQTFGTQWALIVQDAVTTAKRVGAKLIVVDTLARFSLAPGDSENDPAVAQEAMKWLQWASQEHGLAILILRHAPKKKEGVTFATSGRGSGAYSANSEIILHLEKVGGDNDHTRRIKAGGRYPVPSSTLIRWNGQGFAYADAPPSDAALRIEMALEQGATKLDDIVSDSGVSRSTAHRHLQRLMLSGKVTCEGTGKKGDPHIWSLRST